jgi:hypothetical protein
VGALFAEIAIATPVIAMVVIGAVNWGSVYIVHQQMAAASDAGARYFGQPGVEAEQVVQHVRERLSESYPELVRQNAFKVSAGRDQKDDQLVIVNVQLKYSEAGALGGLLLPDSELRTRTAFRLD